MTGMENAIEKAAKVIRSAIEQQADVVADGMHLDVQGVLTPHWIAEALATNGLLAPAQLTEEFGAQFRGGVRTLPDGYRDVGSHHRYVTDWLPVDLARALLAAAKAATSD